MNRRTLGGRLVLAAIAGACFCALDAAAAGGDAALSGRIEALVETFLTSDDESREVSALSDARALFDREGIPGMAKVGDEAAYGFVMMNMLGQPADFRRRFAAAVRRARHALPADAVAFAEARDRQATMEERYAGREPSHPELRDQISRLLIPDQAVRRKEGFDREKMAEADRRTAGPLQTILDRYGVPTYEMVGIQAAKDFVVLVQHQPAEFRRAVLPKLKSNVDAGQADPASYAAVYDRTQRDQGRSQLYGEQLECTSGKPLELAPLQDPANVDRRRAELGLMRLAIYVRLVRLHSPDMCGASGPPTFEPRRSVRTNTAEPLDILRP